MTAGRAQSTVVGVAVLLAMTVLSLTALTVTMGAVVEEGASATEARHVASTIDASLGRPQSGPQEHRVSLGSGRLRTVERSVRLVADDETVVDRRVGGLVYATSDQRVRYVAGATVRDTGGGSRLVGAPSTAVRNGTLFVGLPVLGADSVGVGGDGTTVTLRTNATHRRRHVEGRRSYALAVETRTPTAWRRHFESLGATTDRRSFDDDDVPSVVARFDGVTEVYVFVHDLHLEVRRG